MAASAEVEGVEAAARFKLGQGKEVGEVRAGITLRGERAAKE